MNEVSCKVLDPFFRAADRKGFGRAALLHGVTKYELAHLQNKHERVDYEVFEQIMANGRAHWSDDDIVAIGAEGVGSIGVRSVITVGRTLMTPAGFYKWMMQAGGLGNQMFHNVVPTMKEVEPGHFVVELRTSPGYRPSREFLLMTRGGMEAVSKLLGLGEDASVAMTWTDVGAKYEIKIPVKKSWRAALARRLTRDKDAKAAAADLDDAMKALEARYAELEQARNAVERQKALLDVAYRVGHAIWGEREPAAVGAVVARSLVDLAGFSAARVEARGVDGQGSTADHGAPGEDPPLDVDLTTHRLTGSLRVWSRAGADETDARTLLELLKPTVALALDNAFAYRELHTYQHELERLVDVRTAELRQARDALAESVVQLREAQAARERFFGNVSHEFRTPLTLILLAVADVEARAGEALDARARGDLTSVVDGARKLLRLVDELLMLAAGEATALRLAPEPVDVAALIGGLGATWRLATDQAQLGLDVTLDAPDDPRAMVDPVALERVVTNLMSNAVKFTPSGGRIGLGLRHDGTKVTIEVRDTGAGIDDELLPRLFGRFERARGGGVRGGSGIGLSLVKQLVEAHHGTIAVERLPTGGTLFRVELPVGDVAGAPRVPAAIQARALAPAAKLRPLDFGIGGDAPVASGDVLSPAGVPAGTILVAEDDPRLAAMVARLLSEEYTVIVGLDGLAALELAKKHQPHLLVTDVDMPHMDGIELARRFRQLAGDVLAPIVILSALADPSTRLAGLDAGAVDYVVKPFDPHELKARVRAQFRMRTLAMRLHRAEQLSALGTLSTGLAHELRNPANGIVNSIAPLRRLLPPETTRPESMTGQLFDVLASCAEQVAFVSRHLLGFHRGGELECRTVTLGDVFHRALVIAQTDLDGIEVRTRYDAGAPVLCAPPLLVQVLGNLVSNAAQAVGKGGWVELIAATRDGRTMIEVGDSGAGVPKDLRERVFEPFFTTKPPGQGMGLGLALARDIIQRHHGVLEIRERDDRAVFVIELPAEVAEAAS